MNSKILILFSLLTLPSLAMEKKTESDEPKSEWTVLSELDTAVRKKFLSDSSFAVLANTPINEFIKHFFSSDIRMGNFGYSFTYLGDIESEFLSYLKNIDLAPQTTHAPTVVIPACGNGRTVIDALARTNNVNLIANDLDKTAIQTLERAVEYFYGSRASRVKYQAGNMMAMLKSLPDNSVDAVFSANVIHFLTPSDLNLFIGQISRVLKPSGQLFLQWEGYTPSITYGKLGNEIQRLLEPVLRDRHNNKKKKKIKNPGFIDKPVFEKIGLTCIPHNYLSIEEMSTMATKNSLASLSEGYHASFAYSVARHDTDLVISATYTEQPLSDLPKAFPSISMVLRKTPVDQSLNTSEPTDSKK